MCEPPCWKGAQHIATIYAHISLLELVSLRCPRDSEMFSGSFCSPTHPPPSAAILLLSDRLKTTNLLPGTRSWNNVDGLFSSCCDQPDDHFNAERPSRNELIDQRKVQQILSSHSRWSFGWRQMVHRAGPAEIKILSMPLQISPGTKTKMKLGRFAMREQ